ncbi:MAG: DUF2752 domain-containing protein [Candidatus Hydrogenedentota bacterium]|nr:MAG: DUF2752 domain-containing protein [Candidatus Hydrogenedentota bacterium]
MDIAIIPNAVISPLVADPERRIHWNVLLSHLLVLIVAAMVSCFSIGVSAVPHVCIFRYLFGTPCPGCGITRSFFALFAGDIYRAWMLNPAGPILGVYIVVQIPLRIMALRLESWSRRTFRLSRVLTTGLLIFMFVNWVNHIF